MSLTLTPCCAQVTAERSRKIHEVAGRDPLSDITVQDAELLASYRRFCCVHMPHAIPKLLDAVKWESRRDVAQVRGVTWDSGGGGRQVHKMRNGALSYRPLFVTILLGDLGIVRNDSQSVKRSGYNR